MKMRNKLSALFCAGFMAVALMNAALAQDDQQKEANDSKANTAAPHFYRLDFVVKEVEEAKVLNSRSYSTSISTEQRKVTIRANSRIPIPTGSGSSQFQYMDVGVNVDSDTAQDIAGKLALHVVAEVNSIDKPDAIPKPDALPRPNAPPLVVQFKWEANVLIMPGRASTIFSSDDVTSKRKMQMELTATRTQ